MNHEDINLLGDVEIVIHCSKRWIMSITRNQRYIWYVCITSCFFFTVWMCVCTIRVVFTLVEPSSLLLETTGSDHTLFPSTEVLSPETWVKLLMGQDS